MSGWKNYTNGLGGGGMTAPQSPPRGMLDQAQAWATHAPLFWGGIRGAYPSVRMPYPSWALPGGKLGNPSPCRHSPPQRRGPLVCKKKKAPAPLRDPWAATEPRADGELPPAGVGRPSNAVGVTDAQTAHPATSSTARGTPTTGLRERGNDTSRSTGRSGRQNAATRHNMRRDERVTVQGPVKEQQPDGMSHRGGRGLPAPGAVSERQGARGGGGSHMGGAAWGGCRGGCWARVVVGVVRGVDGLLVSPPRWPIGNQIPPPPTREVLEGGGEGGRWERGDSQTAHHATSSTAPAHQPLGSTNAETTPAGAPAAAADRTQRPDATCEGTNG